MPARCLPGGCCLHATAGKDESQVPPRHGLLLPGSARPSLPHPQHLTQDSAQGVAPRQSFIAWTRDVTAHGHDIRISTRPP